MLPEPKPSRPQTPPTAATDSTSAEPGESADPSRVVGEPDEVIVVPLEPVLDLHSFRPAETRAVVESYLEEVVARGWTEVRIVHGRGRGVQRRIIRALLKSHPAVRSFADAPAHRGGWGATVVHL